MAYEMLTGQMPRDELKPASALNPKVSGEWDKWINKCTKSNPDERFQSACEARDALPQEVGRRDAVVKAESQPVPQQPAKKAARDTVAPLGSPELGTNWTIPDHKIEMIWIAPGSFTMGSPSSERGRDDDEGPQHRVTISKGYWLGKYEVTKGQWQALMGSNPSYFTQSGTNAPVEHVSWNDAQEYCRKLTERERAAGRLPAGYEYSLPTEAQWEFACRAGTTGPYAGTGTLSSMGWYDDNSGSTTHPVGQKQANAWGLYDMHGNVWEWCHDWYGSYPGGAVTDPTGASSGSYRVGRGGSWNLDAGFCRSALRIILDPSNRFINLGFRLALRSVQ